MPKITREPQTIEEERDIWCAHIPNLHNGAYRKVYRKAMTGKSRVAAIRAKCQDCCLWDKAEIADCRAPTCPLYPYRPYTLKTPTKTPTSPSVARGEQETLL